jgi:hypothetical protein
MDWIASQHCAAAPAWDEAGNEALGLYLTRLFLPDV